MANEKNLKPVRKGTKRAKELGSAGGKASVEKRRAKKSLAELASAVMASPVPAGTEAYNTVAAMVANVDPEDITVGALMVAGQAQAAVAGNAQAFRVLTELEEQQRKATAPVPGKLVVDFGLIVAEPYTRLHQRLFKQEITDCWITGGRGSAKSSFVALEIVYALEQDPLANALVMQRTGSDIRNGTFAQIEWALDVLGVNDHWRCTASARRIINEKTGQLILFKGADDPKKTKGVKVRVGQITILWLEEVDQFGGMADIRTIRQSVTRGGAHVTRFYTFNPPRSVDNWANVEFERVRADGDKSTVALKTNYLQVPAEWLGEQFIEDAKGLSEIDEIAYRHEYMGESVGVGGEVFTRAEFRAIKADELARFERPVLGQDWGWWPDPWAFVLSYWEPSTRTLYSVAERRGNRLQPADTSELVKKAITSIGREVDKQKGWNGKGTSPHTKELLTQPVWSDDADPQQIKAHRDNGLNAHPAGKGGNRLKSYEWLAGIKWVIDPKRCPELAKEVRKMCYEQATDGTWLNSIPDGNDHSIDAVRYSVMRIVTHRGAYDTDRK